MVEAGHEFRRHRSCHRRHLLQSLSRLSHGCARWDFSRICTVYSQTRVCINIGLFCCWFVCQSFCLSFCFSVGLLFSGFSFSMLKFLLKVMWGSGIGIGCAILWFILTQKVLTPLFPTIAASSIAEFFLIRDTTLIPNLLIFEYTTSRAEAWKRLKRSEGKKRE